METGNTCKMVSEDRGTKSDAIPTHLSAYRLRESEMVKHQSTTLTTDSRRELAIDDLKGTLGDLVGCADHPLPCASSPTPCETVRPADN